MVESISLSTIWERNENTEYPEGLNYTRPGNPNRNQLEEALARLEGGATSAAFASGSAATAAVLQALKPGDHVIYSKGFYGTKTLVEDVFGKWGLTATLMDTSEVAAVEQAMRPETKLIWAETPTNPMMVVTDIAAITALAKKRGVLSIFDNTLASPILQRPLELGADMVMHSTTKYLGGHSDILGGAIIAKENTPFFQGVRKLQAASRWRAVAIRMLATDARHQDSGDPRAHPDGERAEDRRILRQAPTHGKDPLRRIAFASGA